LPAQNTGTDSLRRQLTVAKQDTNRIHLLIELGRELTRTAPPEALSYSLEAVKLSGKLGFTKGLALAHKNAGLANYSIGAYSETINHWDSSRMVFESMGDKAGVANILSNMGAVYSNFGEDSKALDLYFQAQKTAGETGDSLRLVTTMINIGLVYLKKEATLAKARDIYLQALPIALAIKDNDAIGTASVNLGEAFFKLGQDSVALNYYFQSLAAFERSQSGNVPFTLTSIGRVYSHQGKFSEALENQKRALTIARDLDAKPDMVLALLGLADTYRNMGDTRSAILHFDEARQIAEEMGADFEVRDAYQGLAESYAASSDYFRAFTFQKLLTDIKDTINKSSNDNVIVRQQLSFDLDKKEAELELQELEVQKQRLAKNAVFGGLILILIIAFILLRNYLNKVKINKLLDKQKDQIESLLLNILPAQVAQELQTDGKASPRDYESVTVLFTDFKGFTRIAEGMTPNDLVNELNDFFHAFDDIVERHNLEKIKTIGDAYMCAGGIPTENSTHPIDAVEAGFEMQRFIAARNRQRLALGQEPWDLRIGIHTGPVVAGVVGRKKYAYDIWGSTVNIASRLESNGEVGRVNVSESTYQLIKTTYSCQHRGKISAKNLGEIDMYFVESLN
jgi:class 3 adenylate cyclase/tetratricopeptide (TPR) repeat protein